MLMKKLELEPKEEASRFNYHLRELERAGLIEKLKDDIHGGYQLSIGGERVTQVLDVIEQTAHERVERIFVRTSGGKIEDFNRTKIKLSLVNEAGIPERLAEQISKEAQERLLSFRVQNLNAPMIREFVNVILLEKGLEEIQKELTRAGLPIHDVHRMITHPEDFLRNQAQLLKSPELIQWLAASGVLRQYHLVKVLPQSVTDHHLLGDLHIVRVASWALQPMNIQHDPRFFFEKGFRVQNQPWILRPPQTFREALFQLAKYLEASQTHINSYQNLPFINIFLAPYLKNLDNAHIHQDLRWFIDDINLSYAGRGGLASSISLQCQTEVPSFLESAKVNYPTKKPKSTYSDYTEQAQLFLSILLDVLLETDEQGHPILNPLLILNINQRSINQLKDSELYKKIVRVATETGNILFLNNPKPEENPIVYSGDLSRFVSDWQKDPELDILRTGSIGNIVFNLPRLIRQAKGDDDQVFDEIGQLCDEAVIALTSQHQLLSNRLSKDHVLPLLEAQINGEPYYRLENATHNLSFIGLPEAVEEHTGNSITESSTSLSFAEAILGYMNKRLREYDSDKSLRWTIGPISNRDAAIRLFDLDKPTLSGGNRVHRYSYDNIPLTYSGPLKQVTPLQTILTPFETGGNLFNINLNTTLNSDNFQEVLSILLPEESIELFSVTHPQTYCYHCMEVISGIRRSGQMLYRKRCPKCGSAGQNLGFLSRYEGQLLLLSELPEYSLFPLYSL